MSEDAKEIKVPIEWDYPEDLDSLYATNFIIQHGLEEFFISFFEMKPPLLLGSQEEKEEQLSRIDSINAKCVARIVVSPIRIPELIKVLEENYNTYLAKQDIGQED